MEQLIEALQIFLKYDNPSYPTHCEHDVMYICIEPDKVSADDKAKLEELGFSVGDPMGGGEDTFYSYKYGSA